MTISPANRAFLAFAFVLVLALPSLAFASSYYSTLAFDTSLKGATRSFSGSNMNIYMTATTNRTNRLATTFRVELYRKKLIGVDYIGYSNFPRFGSKSAAWTNVGSGNYYFFFSKANDGITVSSKNVHMYN